MLLGGLHAVSYPWLQFQGIVVATPPEEKPYSFVRSFALVTVVGLLQEAAKATQSSNLGCSEGLMFPTFHDIPHQEMTQLLGICYKHCNRNVSSLIIPLH